MKSIFNSKRLLVACLLAGCLFSLTTDAQEQRRRGRGLWGDWVLKIESDNPQRRRFSSILTFTRSQGKRGAQLISWFGVSDVKNLKFEEGTLSFVLERRNRNGDTVESNYKGTLKDGKISGTVTSGDRERKFTLERSPRPSRATGTWAIEFMVGERLVKNDLVISPAKEDQLKVEWKSTRATHKISEVKYSRGALSFKSHVTIEENEIDIEVKAALRGGALNGKIISENGEIDLKGKLVGAPLVGVWNLESTSERGTRKNRLRVHSDMSGLYGAIPVKKIELKDDGKVTFKIVLEFGERKFEMNFAGKIKENKLEGEMTSSRGTSKVKGSKVVYSRRRPSDRPQSDRKPDAKPEPKKEVKKEEL